MERQATGKRGTSGRSAANLERKVARRIAQFTSDDAERAVIAVVIYQPSTWLEIRDTHIADTDFGIARNAEVWRRVNALMEQAGAVDAVTLAADLKTCDALFPEGAAVWVVETTGLYATPALATRYALQVKNLAVRRAIIRACAKAMDAEPTADTSEVHATLAREVADAAMQNAPEMVTAYDAASRAMLDAEEVWSGRARVGLSDTGFTAIDRAIHTMRRGEVIVVGAREKRGKSRLMLQIEHYAASQGYAVLHVSLEMDAQACITTMAQMVSGVNASAAQKLRPMSTEERTRYTDALLAIQRLPYKIEERTFLTLSDIRLRVAREKSRGKLDFVVIDYLQLVAGDGNSENRRAEVARIAQGLVTLARDFDCVVVAGSQLNKDGDAREAMDIEQAAHKVIKLFRDEDEAGLVGPTRLAVKQRIGLSFGEGAGQTLDWDNERARFVADGNVDLARVDAVTGEVAEF